MRGGGGGAQELDRYFLAAEQATELAQRDQISRIWSDNVAVLRSEKKVNDWEKSKAAGEMLRVLTQVSPAVLSGTFADLMKSQPDAALKLVGADGWASRRPQELSGGQQQRLCIARSVAVKPSVLLLDEPTSALDPISTGKVEELVNELKSDYTIAIVTHNMQQAARVSDFTAYMYLGELIEFGETEQIFFKPTKTATEDYITGRFG